jgi:putative phosphoribosyl transferase
MAQDRSNFDTQPVTIPARDVRLAGDLTVPEGARGIVLFAHGSGSSRHSPRNQFVARQLAESGLATLLFDLLTPAEEERDRWTGELRFDVLLLAHRLSLATQYVRGLPETRALRVGYFGASTGAAAALIAAAALPQVVGAIVSRGGRPDLAFDALEHVAAPTLLIVGSEDREVIELNRQAYARLRCEKRLEIVPGATHLFEEPGTLETVARLAAAWFRHFLVERPQTHSEATQGETR